MIIKQDGSIFSCEDAAQQVLMSVCVSVVDIVENKQQNVPECMQNVSECLCLSKCTGEKNE